MIGKYVGYKEATKSYTAIKYNIDNKPTSKQLQRMKYVAQNSFDVMRKSMGAPVGISSFFRSEELNKKIGGSGNSFHVIGAAYDADADLFPNPEITNKKIFDFLRNNTQFTELIWEFGDKNEPDWVHCALVKGREEEKEVLRAYKDKNGRTRYKKFDL